MRTLLSTSDCIVPKLEGCFVSFCGGVKGGFNGFLIDSQCGFYYSSMTINNPLQGQELAYTEPPLHSLNIYIDNPVVL